MVNLKRALPELDAPAANFPVAEAEAERENAELSKRSKINDIQGGVFGIPPTQYNPRNEPRPLGLRLTKSLSFLDLIQKTVSQANGSSSLTTVPAVNPEEIQFKSVEDNASSPTKEKLKASSFSAALLMIGDWKFESKIDGDLVAKCYFARRALVWEILQDGMKRKMEIPWADITAMKADFSSSGAETLSVTLGRPPHFFRENNPQPRKHTVWLASTDFTDAKASTFRQQTIVFPPGVLHKHYEKLIQVNEHLRLVSQQTDPNQSPYFDGRVPFYRNPKALTFQDLDLFGGAKRSPVSALQGVSSSSSSFNFEEQSRSFGWTPQHVSLDAPSPYSVDFRGSEVNSSQAEKWLQLNSLGIHKSLSPFNFEEQSCSVRLTPQHVSADAPSPFSVGFRGSEGNSSQVENWQQLTALGSNKSMLMSNTVTQIGHHISERIPTNPTSLRPKEAPEGQELLQEVSQYLLSDTSLAPISDERQLMSRVNSLSCLLQGPNNNVGPSSETGTQIEEPKDMSRKDSYSDLFHSLPNIASLPTIFSDKSERDDNLSN